MAPEPQYWTFNLSPYVFEVKNTNFQWVTTWWGVLLLIALFAGSYLLVQKAKFIQPARELVQTILVYVIIIFFILFALNRWNVNWGLRWYSVMYLIGFLAAYFSFSYWSGKKTIMLTKDMVMNAVFFGIIGGLLGARLAYVFIYNWDSYRLHPLSIFATWEGGLSFHGGIVGMSLAFILYCKKNRLPILHIADKACLVIPIGIAFGRIGNFINGELWGRTIESNIPWAIIFPGAGPLPRHPSQIYQSLTEGLGLFLTLFLISRFKQKEGTIFSCFIMFYSLYRFVIEYFRAADVQISYFFLNHFQWSPIEAFPNTPWVLILTMGQILCLLFFLVGAAIWWFTRKNIEEGSDAWVARNHQFFETHKEKE